MDRGRKRVVDADQLRADKRACSSSSTPPPPPPPSSSTPPPPSSSSEPADCDMDTSSSRSERDGDSYGSCDSDDEPNQPHRSLDDSFRCGASKGKFQKILPGLEDDAGLGAQLAALTELCEVLSFCIEESLMQSTLDTCVPLLVKLASSDSSPDIMLLAIRALTYLCDVMPRSSGVLVRHGVIPVLCGRLLAIEYLDVAEQCLQALEKISRNQPVPCLQAGTIMAVLNYIDFFSTSIQRVALSTVANVCQKLPSDCSSLVMEAVPTLCNLLQYEDRKLVETVATCLIRVAECFSHSSELLDELCKHGVINRSLHLIALDGRMTLSQTTQCGLIGLLTKLATGSLLAVRTLFELNISRTLKGILTSSDLSRGTPYSLHEDLHSNQVHEALKLLNQLVPSIARDDKDIQLVLGKEKILADQPQFLHQFAMDILPVSIQVVSSGANLYVCYGCVSIINKIIYFSTAEMLLDLLKNTKISSFLAGLLSRKDHHVVFSSLKIVEILMQRLPDIFSSSFIKEGVIYAIDALMVLEDCPLSLSQQACHVQHTINQMAARDVSRCLCYAFDSSRSPSPSETEACRLGTDTVITFAKHINFTYFNPTSVNSDLISTEILEKLKTFCAVLNDNIDMSLTNDGCDQNEEYMSHILGQIMRELNEGEIMSTFEFIESGIVRSLANYLSNGKYLQGNVVDHRLPNHFLAVMKRFQTFASISLSKAGQSWEDKVLTLLVRKLQNALSSLDNFPVILSHFPKPRYTYADIPVRHSTTHPCLKIHFVKEEGETKLCDYADVLSVEPSTLLDAIEGFLWPKVRTNNNKHHAESAGKDIIQTRDVALGSKCAEENLQERDASKMQKSPKSLSTLAKDLTNQKHQTLPNEESSMKPTEQMTGLPAPVTEITESAFPSTCEGRVVSKISSGSRRNGDSRSKLIFYLEGQQLERYMTIYQAIVQNQVNAEPDITIGPKFWNEVYKVTYKRAREPKIGDPQVPCDVSQLSLSWDKVGLSWQKNPFFSCMLVAELPCKLDKSNPSYDILFLLKILEGLNRFSFNLLSNEKSNAFAEGRIESFDDLKVIVSSVPQTEFLSSRLTEKLEQQLRDPLAVSTGSIPSWCNHLMATCPFLFSFEARWKYFHLTAYGSSRINDNQVQHSSYNSFNSVNDRRSHSGMFPRKKFKVNRSLILESASKIMVSHANSKVALEVEYDEEVGTGLGPTMEFYTMVSHEFQKVGLGMWREDNSSFTAQKLESSMLVGDSGFVVAPFGLFPRPWSEETNSSNGIQFSEVIKKFALLGQLVAKAVQDGRILDLPFSRAFYKAIFDQELDIYDIQSFDPELGRTLLEFQALVNRERFLKSSSVKCSRATSDLCFRNMRIEDLCLDFTLPGYSEYVLTSGSDLKMVNITNLEEYVSLAVDATVRSGISRQLEAFKSGFNKVFPLRALQIFTEEELERLLCGEQDTWAFTELLDHIKFDHGYTASSPPIINFLEIIQEFGCDQRRAFLQFVTGAPRLPPGGLAALNPKLTIVRKHCSNDVDTDLPSVMTCANYLKLPPYSSKERMRQRLVYAITEGQGSFHLS